MNELPKFPATREDASFNWKSWFEETRKRLVEGPKPYVPTPVAPSLGDKNVSLFYGTFEDDEDIEEISLKHEEYRTYMYGNGVELTIHEPTWLIIDKTDATKHIVENATSVYEITPGWIAIKKGY